MAADLTVADWFGEAFAQLHPRLQALHRKGGQLRGPVDVSFGEGLAGTLGRRLAGRLGMPSRPGSHTLEVSIRHQDGVLHWDHRYTRLFGMPVPRAWFPRAVASKTMDGEDYRFSVAVSAPLLGPLLAYSGKLSLLDDMPD